MTKFLVLDTETGGLEPDRHSLLSVGMVVWADGKLGAEDEFFVAESEIECDAEAMAVNGIDINWLTRTGLPPELAVTRLERFLNEQFPVAEYAAIPIAGHNVSFDMAFVRRLYRIAGRGAGPRFSHRALDTASILRFLVLSHWLPGEVSSSSDAFRYFGIDFTAGTRHSALADARATAQLLTELVALTRRT